jgi:UDP-N-acetylglucosamine transferase subunit ALG13
MILLTVGTQLPFDRLVRLMDEIAPALGEPVIAQIGQGSYIPKNMTWHRLIQPVEFERYVSDARFIVSHAGIGSILTAERHNKPIVLFPRTSYLGEHRNEHQMATATMISGRPGVAVANDEAELRVAVHNPPSEEVPLSRSQSCDEICSAISHFLSDPRTRRS